MASGGARQGKTGGAYPNRTDLRGKKVVPIMAATGQGYGVRKQQEDAQRALPIATPAVPQGQPNAPGGAATTAPSFTAPPLNAPTTRPNEPVTAGIREGPGPGPEVLNMGDPLADRLRYIYSLYPSEDLREILEELEA